MFNDDVTTQEEWQDVCMRLQEQGFHEAARHLLADVITTCAMKTAVTVMDRLCVDTAPVELRPADTEARPEEKPRKKGKAKVSNLANLPTQTLQGPSNSAIIITPPPSSSIITTTTNCPLVRSSNDMLPVKLTHKATSPLPSNSSSINTSTQLLRPPERTSNRSARKHQSFSPRRSQHRRSSNKAPADKNEDSEVATDGYDADVE